MEAEPEFMPSTSARPQLLQLTSRMRGGEKEATKKTVEMTEIQAEVMWRCEVKANGAHLRWEMFSSTVVKLALLNLKAQNHPSMPLFTLFLMAVFCALIFNQE